MSTSFLYHAFGLRNHEYEATEYVGGEMTFRFRLRPERLRCAVCGSNEVTLRGRVERRLRGVPIGSKPTWLHVAIPRVGCAQCGVVRQVHLPFAEARVSYTRAFERYVLGLSQLMTMLDVARHVGVSWDMVKDIQKRNLQRRFKRPRLRGLVEIAIDEVYLGKRGRFITVVLDLRTGAVVYVGKGKGAEALVEFWRRLRASRAHIQAVAIDMSQAYVYAVSRHLPKAAIVFDHFHVIKLVNEKLSDLRREVQREAEHKLQKDVLKGTRWLLLKNQENLDDQRNERQRLEEALKLNQPLATAYYLKEDLRQIGSQCSKEAAAAFIQDWCRRAYTSGIRLLSQLANTLGAHRHGILAWYDHHISTGPLEGTINKIRTIQRQAYGFRDREFFTLKILALHETKYAFAG
jgi:transposase